MDKNQSLLVRRHHKQRRKAISRMIVGFWAWGFKLPDQWMIEAKLH